MSIKDYKYTTLNQDQLNKIKEIEGQINKNNGDEIILLAFNKK